MYHFSVQRRYYIYFITREKCKTTRKKQLKRLDTAFSFTTFQTFISSSFEYLTRSLRRNTCWQTSLQNRRHPVSRARYSDARRGAAELSAARFGVCACSSRPRENRTAIPTTGDENAAAAAEVVKNRITSRPFHERRRRTAPDDEMDTALRRRERSVNNASDDFHKSAKSYLAVGCGLSANLPGPSTRRHFRDLTVCVCGTAKTRS